MTGDGISMQVLEDIISRDEAVAGLANLGGELRNREIVVHTYFLPRNRSLEVKARPWQALKVGTA